MVAPRAAWKGFLRVGSVSCGVKIVGVVTEAEKIRFNILNRKTGNRVNSVYADEVTGDIVPADEQIKGWQADKNDFIPIDAEDITKLKLTSEHTLEVDEFVPISDIDTRYLEKPYYLIPADKPSMEAFAVLRDAMKSKKMAARSCVVMYQHGHEIVIQPYGEGMLLTWLRPHSEMADEGSVFEGIPTGKQDPELLEIAGMLIDKKLTEFDPAKFEDRYEQALIELIDAKRKGKKPPKKALPPEPKNVVNLAEVLRKSLEQEGGNVPAKGGKKTKAA
ncbi:Ku protein [Mesorhizobium sp. Root552]|uniref:non-homologous end joining protein Ku n=1 Tax=Mesorhizobium sp. Root552 TaxID=1736555 RepID=UPI0006FB9358|nr:Ku protein [Mesorhizobium sp. Root552]KQZ19509.1 Ku protein [Mesorhizobium sp. Root552]